MEQVRGGSGNSVILELGEDWLSEPSHPGLQESRPLEYLNQSNIRIHWTLDNGSI